MHSEDGKHWRIELDLEPGTYPYRFVLEGKKWVHDPGAKRILDANFNTNSLLVVGYPEGIRPMDTFLHEDADVVWKERGQLFLECKIGAKFSRTAWVEIDGRRIKGKKIRGYLHDRYQFLIPACKPGQEYHFDFSGISTAIFRVPPFSALDVPEWAKGVVFYQVFPDRFATLEPGEKWGENPAKRRFQGGTLLGVMAHGDHLDRLGVQGLYFTPIFAARSYHGYDTTDYERVAPEFGASDHLASLSSWCKQRGYRLLLDGVFNHSGTEWYVFRDLVENGENSKYKNWFIPLGFPIRVESGANTYVGWAGHHHMPKINLQNSEASDYFCKIGKKYIEELGIDGWRLDVANEVPHEFWRKFRKEIRLKNPDAYIVGEHWEDARRWLKGDQWDAAMNYPWRTTTLLLLTNRLSPRRYVEKLEETYRGYPEPALDAVFNLLGSHDTPRIASLLSRPRLFLAYVLLLTARGNACIYYGDEVGMKGGHDPDCRWAMDWSKKNWDMELFEHIRDLIELRKNYPALRRGKCTNVTGGPKSVLQLLFDHYGQKIMVAMNLGKSPEKFDSRVYGKCLAGSDGIELGPDGFTIRLISA